MAETGNPRQGLLDTWRSLTRRQKGAVAAIGAAVVLALVLWVVMYAGQPEYVTLYARLDESDAGEILKKLDDRGVAYRIGDGGSAIMVPADQVHALRMQLAGEGLPRGGVVGFEIIDRTKLGATEFERRVNYVRALQGELTRTIRKIAAVEEARVHIVLPQERLFVSESSPATAAVFVKLRPGAILDSGQVRGIVHLVASSVEGLRPADVTVVDTTGRILSADLESPGGAAALSRLDVQQRFQRELERSLQGLLEQVLGPGNVVARVTAQLNFDERVVDKSLFEPVRDTQGILRSMQELQETFRGTSQSAGGVPGASSNLPTYQAPAGQAGESAAERSQVVKNFELNEIRERLVVAPGSVSRLSVAVVVNRQLAPAEQQAIEATVAAAIGVDPERRDSIIVTGMTFDTTMAEAVKADMEAQAAAEQRLRSNVTRGAIAAAALLAIWWFRGRRRRAAEPVTGPARGVAPGYGAFRRAELAVGAAGTGRVGAGSSAMGFAGLPQIELSPEEQERLERRERIQGLAREQPESVAQLLRTWLSED